MERGKNRTVSDKNKLEEEKNTEKEFSWDDGEIQLSLTFVYDFKAQCEFEDLDWESKRSKYEQMFGLLMKQYPTIE